MRYVDVQLLNADGSPADDNGKPATALAGIKKALVTDGKQWSPDQKLRRYELFTKLVRADGAPYVDLSIEEAAIAKEAADLYPTLVYGQLVSFLNNNDRHEKDRDI